MANYIIFSKDGATAVAESKPEQSLSINNRATLTDIAELIEQRRSLGIKLSQMLKKDGLTAANEDEPTEVIG